MSEKVVGYLVVGIGLVIMVICVVNVFMVFTNRIKPFQTFNLSSSGSNSPINVNDIIAQIQKNNPNAQTQSIPAPKLDILPPEVLNQTLNMTTHFFLMSFLLGFGYKLASLGIQLVRPINVKLKSHLLEVMNDGKQEITSASNVQPSQPASPQRPLQTVQPLQPT